MRRVTPLVLLAVACLAACSSSGSTSTTTAAVASTPGAGATVPEASGSATTPPAGPTTTAAPRAKTLAEAKQVVATGNSLTDAQASCVVDKMVVAVGEARTLMIVNDVRDLSEMAVDDAKTATAALVACVDKKDFGKVIAESFYESLKDIGVTQQQATCFGDKLVATLSSEALAGLSSVGSLDQLDPATQGQVLAALGACLPPDLLGQLGATPGAGASTTSSKP